jgi:hypothetical protein
METMMVEIKGTLTVKAITGRNGVFRTGELETAVGDFKVKDKILEQFEAGSYTGRFIIERIFPECYIWYGKVITEVRARLADVDIDQDEPAPPAQEAAAPAEPDPAEQAGDRAEGKPAPDARPSGDAIATEDASGSADAPTSPVTPCSEADGASAAEAIDDGVRALFGDEILEAIEAGAPVRLDPTVDRVMFREQRTALKTRLGYGFKASTQTWYKA